MMQRVSVRLLGLGILLAVTIALELTGIVTDDSVIVTDISPSPVAWRNPARVPLTPRDDQQALVKGILARPLFAATRRPVAAVAVAALPRTTLPRLAGTLVNGPSRSAIFAATGEGRPVVVQEGAQVSGYIVQSIEAGKVTLSGLGVQRVLQPTFDIRPQDTASGPAVVGPVVRNIPTFTAPNGAMQALPILPRLSGGTAR